MIIRNTEIRFGNALIDTTPFDADATIGGQPTRIAGIRMKNITDADCVGVVDLVFLNKNGLEVFKRKLQEMEEIWDKPISGDTND